MVISLVSPVFADDYIYTNKDLEKYKTPPQNILQPAGDTGDKSAQSKKVLPSRKKQRQEKSTQLVIPSRNRKKQIKVEDKVTIWPQNVQTQ